MRVCFFNRSYWPDTGATGQLLTELAEDLAARHGFEVTVVTGQPPPQAGGRLPRRDTRGGVRVIRAAGTTFSPRRFAGRATNYLTYFLSAFGTALFLPRQDVTVALTDPPIIGLAALAARPRCGMVFFCQDIFPEVAGLLEDFQSPAVNAVLDRLNRFLVARAARIVALGDTMARRLVAGKGADPARITVIHNWADTSAIAPAGKDNAFSRAHGLADRLVVLHAGNIGLSQNLDVVLDAADLLRARPDIVLLFIGDGNRRSALEQAVRSRALDNVRFLPFQSRDQLRWTYATADVCLVSLKPGLAGYIVPSKLYPILAAGRPFVAAVDDDSEVAAITRQHGCGVVVEPGSATALAQQILALADDPARRRDMGTRARAASAHFSRDSQVASHANLLRDVGARRC
ncbi:MAG: glycosyltransferase family 4 protein [Vicinamibacterales bacterium]